MSFASFYSFACKCDGKLDLYEQGTGATSFNRFYRRSSALDPTDATEVSRWNIPMSQTGVIRDAVANRQNQVFEIIRVSASYYLTRYDVVSQSVVWHVPLNFAYADSTPMLLWAGPDNNGVVRENVSSNPSHTYEIWDAGGVIDSRGPFTKPVNPRFSPRLSNYSNAGVLAGTTAIPQCVSRWEYPACIGWRLASYSFSAWIINGIFQLQSTLSYTFELVAGELDWDTDGPPCMTADEVLDTLNGEVTVTYPPGTAEEDAEADALSKLVPWMVGDRTEPGPYANPSSARPYICNVFPFGAGVGRLDFDRFNRSGWGVGAYEKHKNGHHGYWRRYGETEPDDLNVSPEFVINGTTVMDTPLFFTLFDFNPHSLVSVPDDDLGFVISYLDFDLYYHIDAYNTDGSLAWELTRDSLLDFGAGHAMCASDRYIYIANCERALADTVGGNLPDFSPGAGATYGTGTWCDWAVSLDGSRWNPCRAPSALGAAERFWGSNGLGHVDCIKDSTAIPLCPPDDWF